MVKLDFGKQTVQLWPEEYTGHLTVQDTCITFTHPNLGPRTIILPASWSTNRKTYDHDLPRPSPTNPLNCLLSQTFSSSQPEKERDTRSGIVIDTSLDSSKILNTFL